MALLSAFNPHDLPEATIRGVATGRESELADIIATVRSSLDRQTVQHLIVSAPRGYGKSFLMRHLQLDIQKIARDEQLPLAVVLMPEEMPHVREPHTLIREIARTLRGSASHEAELHWHENAREWQLAVDDLNAAIEEKIGAGGLLVALVENFDSLLRQAFPKDVQSGLLRALLTRRGSRLMLVAASSSGALDQDYDRPLFKAFREIPLEPWTPQQCLEFFDRQQAQAGNPPLSGNRLARARAVSAFIGGTPRLATLLGEALLRSDILRAADLLAAMIDELTPYYKHRIEELPGRSQKLLDALLRFGEPATPTELARRVNANSQAAIAQSLANLAHEQIIVADKAIGSAEKLYRVADRVFAHYYRKRILSDVTQPSPLEPLVDFLADCFSSREIQNVVEQLLKIDRLQEAEILMDIVRGRVNEWSSLSADYIQITYKLANQEKIDSSGLNEVRDVMSQFILKTSLVIGQEETEQLIRGAFHLFGVFAGMRFAGDLPEFSLEAERFMRQAGGHLPESLVLPSAANLLIGGLVGIVMAIARGQTVPRDFDTAVLLGAMPDGRVKEMWTAILLYLAAGKDAAAIQRHDPDIVRFAIEAVAAAELRASEPLPNAPIPGTTP